MFRLPVTASVIGLFTSKVGIVAANVYLYLPAPRSTHWPVLSRDGLPFDGDQVVVVAAGGVPHRRDEPQGDDARGRPAQPVERLVQVVDHRDLDARLLAGRHVGDGADRDLEAGADEVAPEPRSGSTPCPPGCRGSRSVGRSGPQPARPLSSRAGWTTGARASPPPGRTSVRAAEVTWDLLLQAVSRGMLGVTHIGIQRIRAES